MIWWDLFSRVNHKNGVPSWLCLLSLCAKLTFFWVGFGLWCCRGYNYEGNCCVAVHKCRMEM